MTTNDSRPALIKGPSVMPDGVQVMFIGSRPKIGKEGDPFAAVVATSPEPMTATAARVCLHVFRDPDGEFSFADGVVAIDQGADFIGDAITWPELHAALSLSVKGFAGIMNTRPNEPGHIRVKILEEDAYAAKPPDPEAGHATLALTLLQNWNQWIKDDETFNARALAINPKLRSATQDMLNSAADNLRKFCGSIGLDKNRRVEFTQPWRQLVHLLIIAEEIDSRLRRSTKKPLS